MAARRCVFYLASFLVFRLALPGINLGMYLGLGCDCCYCNACLLEDVWCGVTQYRTLDFRHKHTHSGAGVEAHMALWEGVARRKGVRIYRPDEEKAVCFGLIDFLYGSYGEL